MSEVKVNGSACCDRSGRAAFTVPAIKLPALCGQRRFAPALFVVAAGACSFPGRITRLSPFAGAETSTTRLAVTGTAEPFAINFSRPFRCRFIRPKKFPAHPGHLHRAVLVYALAANGSQTGEVNTGGRFSRSPHKVKTAAPATQRVMFFKNQEKEKCRILHCERIGSHFWDAMPAAICRCLPGAGHDRKTGDKAFIERCEPVKGWFLGAPEDITDQVKKEEEEAGSKPQV